MARGAGKAASSPPAADGAASATASAAAAGDVAPTLPDAEPLAGSSVDERVDTAYGAAQITVLEGLEPVRRRPGMYIGSTGPRGLHHLVYEVVDNAVDEALAGHCTLITVTLHADGSASVSDDGRGIPTGLHPVTGKSALETVLTVLHAGGKFGGATDGSASGYNVSGGLHGVGVSVVNALSEWLSVSVWKDNGQRADMSFERGVPVTDLAEGPATPAVLSATANGSDALLPPPMRGTCVRFKPDATIFAAGTDLSTTTLAGRLDELAYLNAGLRIVLVDERLAKGDALPLAGGSAWPRAEEDVGGGAPSVSDDITAATAAVALNDPDGVIPLAGTSVGAAAAAAAGLPPAASAVAVDNDSRWSREFCHRGGIAEYVSWLCRSKTALHDGPISLTATVRGVAVAIALQWSSDSYAEAIQGYANNIRTADGGTHLEGLRAALTRTVNTLGRKANKLKEGAPNLSGDHVREGLTAVVSVKVADPEFEGQTKGKLGNPEVRSAVEQAVARELSDHFELNPKILADIVEKGLAAAAAADAAKRARDVVRRKSALESTTLPGKLADCASRDATAAEIFIVEGVSAGGSAKQGRDRAFQAILPLRGKILNVEKTDDARMYGNSEVQALVTALGLGVKGEAFDPAALRYHRIIIMTDADVDGAHIRTLLLTFFFRYQRALLEEGYVYIACPPLYKVEAPGVTADSMSAGAANGGGGGTAGAGGSRRRTPKGPLYLYSDRQLRDLQTARAAAGKTGRLAITRFKGLGEMMATQLWTTTMDPSTRRLKRVEVADGMDADRVFSMLMGDRVAPRREFIETHAGSVSLTELDF